MKITCPTESSLLQAAEQLLETYPGPRVFALYGPMGAGKTTFIKKICSLLWVSDPVLSPSFSIINEYRTYSGKSVFHFDFYRIKKTEEVFDIGYEDYFYSGQYCFIEWPELVEKLLPGTTIRVRITPVPAGNSRLIEF